MAQTVGTEQALQAVDAAAQEWEDLVVAVGPERAEQPGPGGWTLKDLAGHLTGWENRTLNLLEDPQATAPWGEGLEIDEINAFISRRNADRSLGDVLRDTALMFGRLREIVERLPEADLNDPNRFPALDGASLGQQLGDGSYFSHIRAAHGADIAAWREQSQKV